jgi:hypothetical protein
MAALSPMTWDVRWKLAATGVAALAGWVASPPPQLAAPIASPPGVALTRAEATAVEALAEQTRRLDQHLEAAQAMPPSRNLFRFGARPVVRRVVPPPPPAVALAPVVQAPAPFPMRLTGIAVDVVNGVEKRTAILSGPAGLELASSGEPAGQGYRVVEVGAAFAEIERLSDGARERLTLRP